jgi:hypothetical protein
VICRLYVRLCRRFGPRINGRRATVSAWAWNRAQETGDTWWRDRIDGAWLLCGGGSNHCQSQFQKERHKPSAISNQDDGAAAE